MDDPVKLNCLNIKVTHSLHRDILIVFYSHLGYQSACLTNPTSAVVISILFYIHNKVVCIHKTTCNVFVIYFNIVNLQDFSGIDQRIATSILCLIINVINTII